MTRTASDRIRLTYFIVIHHKVSADILNRVAETALKTGGIEKITARSEEPDTPLFQIQNVISELVG